MNELKFIAYVPELNKTVEVVGLNPLNKTVYLSNWDLCGREGDDVLRSYDPADNDVRVRQYTGMKDVNNVDIYADDVVEYLDGEFSYAAIVTFDDTVGCYFMVGISPNDNFSFEDCGPSTHKVIGNIHEHPELLEKAS